MARCSRSSSGGQLGGRFVKLAALDGQVGRRQAAAHLADHAGGGHGHHRRLARGRRAVADRRKQLGDVDVLQLLGPAAGQKMVEVLPRAAKRLPQRLGLGTQPRGVRRRELSQQLLVERIAVDGDLLHQRGQRHSGIVGVGPVSAHARSHQHRSRQHGRLLEQNLLAREPAVAGQAVEHGVESNLLQHEAAAAARVVQLVHVPLAEQVIGPLVHGVVEVVSPRVEANSSSCSRENMLSSSIAGSAPSRMARADSTNSR